MSFFSFFKGPDINQGVTECRSTPGAVLLDVRTPSEYREGHISGSKNVPLQTIRTVKSVIPGLEVPLYVYCHSGARSRQATAALQKMGYTNVTNIGGIAAWTGKVEN
ncbi:MAG: rhodanese-like domain-containing protein [Lachnospiraceae bacterium]|nr:rhodanese-like domain-containing protein [Lachnospiraceae bacterium]